MMPPYGVWNWDSANGVFSAIARPVGGVIAGERPSRISSR